MLGGVSNGAVGSHGLAELESRKENRKEHRANPLEGGALSGEEENTIFICSPFCMPFGKLSFMLIGLVCLPTFYLMLLRAGGLGLQAEVREESLV